MEPGYGGGSYGQSGVVWVGQAASTYATAQRATGPGPTPDCSYRSLAVRRRGEGRDKACARVPVTGLRRCIRLDRGA